MPSSAGSLAGIDGNPSTSHLFRSESEDQDVPLVDIEKVDLQVLAEEVVALLRQELRQEGERRGWHRVW